MCSCTPIDAGTPHTETPKPGMIIGEQGLALVVYTGEHNLVVKAGDVTGVVYRFENNKPRYVDKRDIVFILDENFKAL